MSIYTEHFENVFGTKQNIQALRNKVLELGIQGKLVEQDLNDKSTSELLQDIQTEKKRLIKEKKIKKTKLLPEIKAEEVPFKIPESWEWVKFGGFAVISGGKRIPKGYTYSEQKTEHVYLRVTDMKKGSIDLFNLKYINDEVFQQIKNYTIDADDLYITVAGTIGKIGTVPTEVAGMNLTENADKITSIMVNQLFVKYALESQYVQKQIFDSVNKMAQPKLSIQSIQQLVLPLPPVGEQKRIVTKIESLMSKIDQLEKYLERKERLKAVLPQAVVSAISNCQNEEELKIQLGLVIEYFTEIFQTPESLQELRNVMLQLGIQGKLIPQNPSDEPASELLKHIQAEKEFLIKEKKIKKEKALPQIKDDEIPFEIPESWAWVRLGKIALINPRNSLDDNLKVGFIPMTLIKDGYGNDYSYEIKEWKAIKKGYTHFKQGDIVVAKITPCFENRKSAILYELSSGFGAGTTELHVIRVEEKFVSKEYLLYLFKTAWFISLGVDTFQGTAGQQRIGTDFITQSSIPLPPLAEQERIVGRIESLFAVIDKLEKELLRKKRIVEAMATV